MRRRNSIIHLKNNIVPKQKIIQDNNCKKSDSLSVAVKKNSVFAGSLFRLPGIVKRESCGKTERYKKFNMFILFQKAQNCS